MQHLFLFTNIVSIHGYIYINNNLWYSIVYSCSLKYDDVIHSSSEDVNGNNWRCKSWSLSAFISANSWYILRVPSKMGELHTICVSKRAPSGGRGLAISSLYRRDLPVQEPDVTTRLAELSLHFLVLPPVGADCFCVHGWIYYDTNVVTHRYYDLNITMYPSTHTPRVHQSYNSSG